MVLLKSSGAFGEINVKLANGLSRHSWLGKRSPLTRKRRVFRVILPYDRKGSQTAARGRGGMAYAADLRKNLSPRREISDAELLKFEETSNGNPEPSPERNQPGRCRD
jgi:hypothetical protein